MDRQDSVTGTPHGAPIETNGPETAYGPAGNVDNKYETRNPIARRLVAGFLRTFDALVDQSGARTVLDVGCGEGVLSCRLGSRGLDVHGVDVSPTIIRQARERWVNTAVQTVDCEDGVRTDMPSAERRSGQVAFEAVDLHTLDPDRYRAPLVICCEVLEHVPDPQAALAVLTQLADPLLLVSVPREPIWRTLNMARGRYLTALGNTPGHIQHWSRRRFLSFLSPAVEILAVRTPLPWTMVLGRVRHG